MRKYIGCCFYNNQVDNDFRYNWDGVILFKKSTTKNRKTQTCHNLKILNNKFGIIKQEKFI